MPTYTKSISHDIYLDDGRDALKALLDVVAALANDLDFTDGRVQIRVVKDGSLVDDPVGGRVAVLDQQVDVVQAIREFPSSRDIEQSNGHIRINDRKFHYKASAASFVPSIGDHVTYNGTTFEIVAVDLQTLGTRYLVWCRA